MARRAIKLGPEALRHFKSLRAAERARLKAAMQAALGDDDATVPSRNKFRLRRPSGLFEYELREGDLRVFYRVKDDRALIDAIGRKKGNLLFIDDKKVTL